MKIPFHFLQNRIRVLSLLCACCMLLSLGVPALAEDTANEIPALIEPVGVKIDAVAAYVGEIYEIDVSSLDHI